MNKILFMLRIFTFKTPVTLLIIKPNMSLIKKDRTGQDRTGQSKKSQSGNISPIWGEAPTVPIETKICTAGNLADVITCAKFQDEIFRGYDFTGGPISHFPIDFCMGLTTVQRDCAACDGAKQILISLNCSSLTQKCAWQTYKEIDRQTDILRANIELHYIAQTNKINKFKCF